MADIARMEEEGCQVLEVEYPETPDTYAEDIWEQDEYQDNYRSYAPDFKAMELEDAKSDEDEELTLDSEKGDGGGEEKDGFYELSSDRTNDIIAIGSVRGRNRRSFSEVNHRLWGYYSVHRSKISQRTRPEDSKVHAKRVKVATKTAASSTR